MEELERTGEGNMDNPRNISHTLGEVAPNDCHSVPGVEEAQAETLLFLHAMSL